MKFDPGFLSALRADFERIKPEIRARVNDAGGFSESTLITSLAHPEDDTITRVDHCAPSDVFCAASLEFYREQGLELIRAGRVAFCVLAGGHDMLGRHDAILPLTHTEISQLDVKLAQAITIDALAGGIDLVPVWIMVQPSHIHDTIHYVTTLSKFAIQQKRIDVFEQFESYRLFPNNSIAFTSYDEPLLYPTGTGDFNDALIRSGLLEAYPFIEYIVVVNSNNIAADINLSLLGHHCDSKAEITCEVVPKIASDPGHIPAWVNNKIQLVPQSQCPLNFNVDGAMYVSTNSMIISVSAIQSVGVPWRWHRRRRQVGQALYVQYERQLSQATIPMHTNFVACGRNRYVMRYMREAPELASAITDGVIVQ